MLWRVVWDEIRKALEELEVAAKGTLDVVSFQKPPRGQEGWELNEVGQWHFHSFRDAECWRGLGVAYKFADWSVMRKKSSAHGVRTTPKGPRSRSMRRKYMESCKHCLLPLCPSSTEVMGTLQ